MNTVRRISPTCPKCQQQNTYDIIPELPKIDEEQLNENRLNYLDTFTVGNAKYHCLNCGHTWKKYRGKKPYDKIKVIHAEVGGFPGLYFNVKIDLENGTVEMDVDGLVRDLEKFDRFRSLSHEEMEWFKSELYKCDFINWAEEYFIYAQDGTHWSVRIEYDTHCEIKTGSNHFPPRWTKFRKAVSRVSGSDFY
ncbi:hypothetical protein [Peribacillus acanthi]|uniref:hypothetical protein n=1 Tax=Peribacillus acanthi TaxID=2171554 RepID=UPI000D3EC171|nr:hypothetical protein [Peribacillus acanthi]